MKYTVAPSLGYIYFVSLLTVASQCSQPVTAVLQANLGVALPGSQANSRALYNATWPTPYLVRNESIIGPTGPYLIGCYTTVSYQIDTTQ